MERTDGLGRYLQHFQVEKDDTRAKGLYKHLFFVKKKQIMLDTKKCSSILH